MLKFTNVTYERTKASLFFLKEKSEHKYNFAESFCMFFFIIFLPVLWTVIRNYVFPNYTSEYRFDKSLVSLPLSITVFVFQVAFPLMGLVAQTLISKRKMYLDGLAFIYLYVAISPIIQILFSSYYVVEVILLIINITLIVLYSIFVSAFKNSVKAFFSLKGSYYFIVLIALIYALTLAFSILGALTVSGSSTNEEQLALTQNDFFKITGILIIAPIIEEIFVRRVIFVAFNKNWLGYLLASFYFAFMHIEYGGDWSSFISYFLPSLTLSLSLGLFKNAIPGIGAHMLNNIIATFA